MKASPALALLVGYLVLGAGGGGEAVSQTAPAVALANQLAKTDTSKLSDSVSDFLARLGPMAHSATVDLVASLRDGSGQAHVEQRVPGKGASEARPGVPPAPKPRLPDVHLKVPPPAPPMTEAERAHVQRDRAMYERIKRMNDQDDLAAAAGQDLSSER